MSIMAPLQFGELSRILKVYVLFVVGSAWAAAPCVGTQQKLDLAKWKLTVRGARTGPALVAALNAAAFLRDAKDRPIGQERLKGLRKVESVLVDDFGAQLSGAATAEHIVQVVVRGLSWPSFEGSATSPHYRLRVVRALRPGEGHEWCDLGVVVSEEDVIEPECNDFPGTTFGFEHVLAPDSQVIRTTRDEQICNPGGRDQGTTRSVAYLALVKGQLTTIFEQVVGLSTYNVMSGRRIENATITFTDTFPRVLNVESTRLCTSGMASTNFCVVKGEPGPGGEATSERSKATFVFNGTRYVERRLEMTRETSTEPPYQH